MGTMLSPQGCLKTLTCCCSECTAHTGMCSTPNATCHTYTYRLQNACIELEHMVAAGASRLQVLLLIMQGSMEQEQAQLERQQREEQLAAPLAGHAAGPCMGIMHTQSGAWCPCTQC